MSTGPTLEEMRTRLQEEIQHFGGVMPERVALVWHGYLAALIEWGLITINEHAQLTEMLPKIPDNPVMAVFLGRE
jgi:hypothetical protein